MAVTDSKWITGSLQLGELAKTNSDLEDSSAQSGICLCGDTVMNVTPLRAQSPAPFSCWPGIYPAECKQIIE